MQRTSKGQKKMFCPTDRTPVVSRGASGNHLGTGSENQAAGMRAAVAAGRHPVDFAQLGPVDRAVMAEIGRYQTRPRKSPADRARLRAALIPFFHLSGVA